MIRQRTGQVGGFDRSGRKFHKTRDPPFHDRPAVASIFLGCGSVIA